MSELEKLLINIEEGVRQEEHLKAALQEAKTLFDQGDYSGAKKAYEEVLAMDATNISASTGRINSLIKAGENAEKKGHIFDAKGYYNDALAKDPGNVFARNGLERVKRRMIAQFGVIASIIIIIGLILLAQSNHFIMWPQSVCDSSQVGGLLCTPTNTPTLTPTYTLTPSLTPTLTPTMTVTPSPTPTLTPTITSTPAPVMGQVITGYTEVTRPDGSFLLSHLGDKWFICGETDNSYYVSSTYCFPNSKTGLGVIRKNDIRVLLNSAP